MPISTKGGVHYRDAWLMEPHSDGATVINFYNVGDALNTSATTAFFTGFASFGVQDNTNWTANTYKTIFSHTGQGIVYAMIACTAGGAETTTFEITIDGVLKTITITNANAARAYLTAAGHTNTSGTEFTTATVAAKSNGEALDAATGTTFFNNSTVIPSLKYCANLGIPALRYDVSCLIRMKHSAIVNNTTAEAFSGVLVRKGIAS